LNDTVRALLVAAALSAASVSMLAWRVARFDPTLPDRLIGELRLARWAAVLLSAVGGIPIGLAVARPEVAAGTVDLAFGVVFVGWAGVVLQREPREGLWLSAAGFVAHALIDIAHRPGWLSPDIAPHWYTVGCAIYDVFIAALCYWARRR
jgi:hypothetical protein